VILLINNLDKPEIGQSRVVEQVIDCLMHGDHNVRVFRASSSRLSVQVWLIIRVWFCCLTRNVEQVYYTPSRSRLGMLRDIGVYLPCIANRRQLIVHWHGCDIDVYDDNKALYVSLIRRILASAKHICIARGQAVIVLRIWPGADVIVVPNAVDRGFSESCERLSLEAPHDPDGFTHVAMLGNLMLSKGVDIYCEVARRLSGVKNFQFHLYGPFASDLQTSAAEIQAMVCRHSDCIRYHGAVFDEEKVRAYLRADILLFPSRGEAMPLVVLEALEAKCHVIASNVGYLNELKSADRLTIINDFEIIGSWAAACLSVEEGLRPAAGSVERSKAKAVANYCSHVRAAFRV
jgi:glycosyltransferase involved in cell wall biosynthesis